MSGNAKGFSADWTSGTEAICYQSCPTCKSVWYFRRQFCPSCGKLDPVTKQAAGGGVVYAETLVHRAPVPEAREHVPYKIVLVDIDEGLRIMAHGTLDLKIGDRVVAGYRPFLGSLLPLFAKI